MIAEAWPESSELAKQTDLLELRAEFRVFTERMEARFSEFEARLLRWMIASFIPLWLGFAGMVVALLVRGS